MPSKANYVVVLLLFALGFGCATHQDPPVLQPPKTESADTQVKPPKEVIYPRILDIEAVPGIYDVDGEGPWPYYSNPDTELLDHKYFQVFYDPKIRLPRYVKYVLKSQNLKIRKAIRKDNFFPDPQLTEKGLPYVGKEKFGEGYQQGHMAPSADFLWSQKANDETFVMSNMVPQTKNLNEQSWAYLERDLRKYAMCEDRLIIISGPIMKKNLPVLKSNGLPIPERFFKIVIDDTPPRKVLAFILNQTDEGVVTAQRVVPYREVLDATEINFEKQFPEDYKKLFRNSSKLEAWNVGKCAPKKKKTKATKKAA